MNILNKITKNYLKLNKKRTIVTIIGIIISGAMLSAITTLSGSFQNFMINAQKEENGNWQAIFQNVDYEDLKYIELNNKFETTVKSVKLYMGENKYSNEEYIRIEGYEPDTIKTLGERIIAGRMPENSNEIALSSSFFDDKENTPQIGDTITFPVGTIEETENLKFTQTGTKTYYLCGMIQRPKFEKSEDYYTAGITILDKNEIKDNTTFNVGVISKNVKNLYKDTEKIADDIGLYTDIEEQYFEDGSYYEAQRKYNIIYNTGVLMYMGVSDDAGFQAMMYSVCGILIAVIMVGSVLVIYNSFAISVSERKKQFGMLSSIGATKKQIKKSVLYEGVVLGIIGIPLGIVSGILGIGITLQIVNNLLKPIFGEVYQNLNLEIVISWPAIFIAAILMAITIYMSVIIPARRASRITPIEAIRQVGDIKVKPKKLKTPKFIRRIFGIEGEIALKNLKRSKKRYRTTVISLIISIVLYISVSGFVGYMFSGFNTLYLTSDYDASVRFSSQNENKETKQEVINKILNMEDMERCSYIKSYYTNIHIPEEKVRDNIKELVSNRDNYLYNTYDVDQKEYNFSAEIISLNDEEFKKYLNEIGIQNLEDNQVIIMDYANLLMSYHLETNITNYKTGEKLPITITEYDEGKEITEKHLNLEIAKVTSKAPLGFSHNYDLRLICIVNEETFSENISSDYISEEIRIKSNKLESIDKQIDEIIAETQNLNINYYNVAKEFEAQKNLKLVIQIFLYGFIVLISAIGVSNIFNTISTNINLRRREFANLKSIGMTDKQFKRMLDLECIFYGTKALLYGLPIGIFICYLMNRGFANVVEFIFTLPLTEILIAIIAVYGIVFATMIYSSRKVKKENIIDVLRDENI